MKKRILQSVLRIFFSLMAIAFCTTQAYSLEDSSAYLESTEYLNYDSPIIQEALVAIIAGAKTSEEKAERIFYFVRDDINFGWTPEIYGMKATDVLTRRIGFSNTKATLFIALLRAVGIPARQRFYKMKHNVIRGFIYRPNRRLDHSYTELYLNDKWVKTDRYVVDKPLYLAAQKKLKKERRQFGYGIRRDGSIEWDSIHGGFIQFYGEGSKHIDIEHGVYKDVPDFYAKNKGNDRIPKISSKYIIRQYIGGVQKRVAAVRDGK